MRENGLRVLLLGSGGRESALAWKLCQSPLLGKLWITPGNSYTGTIGENLFVDVSDIRAIVKKAVDLRIDFAVSGPEDPLVFGIADAFGEVGIPLFGPGSIAAVWTEGRKDYSAKLMQQACVPHPRSLLFGNPEQAITGLRENFFPCAVKYHGLAAGKGVWVCETWEQAREALLVCQEKWPNQPVVVQEMREGIELSVFGFYDGKTLSSLIGACDYKRRFSADTGVNTGGMASYAPPAFWNKALEQRIRNTIFLPILDALEQKGILYRGILYAGLMLCAGGPEVLELNCRFGDPEGQVIMPLLENDLLEVMVACQQGRLHELEIAWKENQTCVGVVLVDKGYPEHVGNQGCFVSGLDKEELGTLVFPYALIRHFLQSGESYTVLSGGGRRVAVVGIGEHFQDALLMAECRMQDITFNGQDWIIPIERVIPPEWASVYPSSV
jgi:phosphoribosylamine---glycine ligase